MFFIWKGKGGFVFLAIILDFVLTAIFSLLLGFKDATVQIMILEFILAILLFIPIWICGKKWNSEKRELIDKATGKEFMVTNQNQVFWIPMQYWAIIYPVIILLVIIFSKF
jgi:hypothetical protein